MLSPEEKKEALQEMLTTKFPFKRMLVTTVIGIILSIILIVFQILSIVYQTPLYYIGVG
jgi:hypothetical protein